MKDTVQMILGEMPNLYALATLRDETEPITVAARRLLSGAKSFLPFNPFCCMDRFDNSEHARNITVWTGMACER